MSGFLKKLQSGLTRSSKVLGDGLAALVGGKKLSPDQLQALEELLVSADLGLVAARQIVANLQKNKTPAALDETALRVAVADEIATLLKPAQQPLVLPKNTKPAVIVMVGVNGSGKTTTIGKLAQKFADEGKSVMLAACDTFRAAATEQLEIWASRAGADFFGGVSGADAAALAFQAHEKARTQNSDILLVDTAGRLQNNETLMAQLAKLIRVLGKADATAPHATLLVMDATTGQNGLRQAEIFRETAAINGLIMTKLDGTARGGVLLPVALKLALPIYFVGVGEQAQDLQLFDARDFAAALTGAEGVLE